MSWQKDQAWRAQHYWKVSEREMAVGRLVMVGTKTEKLNTMYSSETMASRMTSKLLRDFSYKMRLKEELAVFHRSRYGHNTQSQMAVVSEVCL